MMALGILLLSSCSTDDIIVRARTQGSSVQFEIDEISLRTSEQAWYDDWVHLEHAEKAQLDSDWLEIGWLKAPLQEYHHIFVDADRIMFNGEEIKDIVEPTYLGRPITGGTISLELEVLEAPDGLGLFLNSAD